jgi:hypothetical protein
MWPVTGKQRNAYEKEAGQKNRDEIQPQPRNHGAPAGLAVFAARISLFHP